VAVPVSLRAVGDRARQALIDPIESVLPATPDDFWFIDGLGRRKLPRIRQGVKPA
jgi:hypothetical protein